MNKIESFLKKGYLVSPDFKDNVEEINDDFFDKVGRKITTNKPIVINNDFFLIINHSEVNLNVNWNEFERSRTFLEKGKNGKMYYMFLDMLNYNLSEDKKMIMNELMNNNEETEISNIEEGDSKNSNVIVLNSYNKASNTRLVEDFVLYFKNRYNFLKNLLKNRQELINTISISRLYGRSNRDVVSIIGIVSDKSITKNGNILLKVEDLTGSISVLANKNNEVFNIAKDVVLDEVIGVSGIIGNKILFSNFIATPDVSLTKELKKINEDVYVAFTGDMHIGSKLFLGEDFIRFIKWINGENGNNKQREVAKKIKYLFIVGDSVAGIGIYPKQEDELNIKDIREKYEEVARLLNMIRKDVKIIICPGNHDAVRIAEPQPAIDENMAKSLCNMENVYMVSNPCLINIHSSKDFDGFDVLMYHGYSFDYYAANVDSIREKGAYDAADEIMKFLLKKRHLAPSHTSTLYIPDAEEDPLLISKVPDIFVTGHVHRMRVGNYNNVTTICSSCWESKTDFQERTGHNPQPSRVPIVNLRTRDVMVLRFDKE